MAFSDEERRWNLQAISAQVNADVEAFLRRTAHDPRGFDADDLVEFVRYERFDRRAAQLRIMALKEQGRVHLLAGRWHAGPLPSENSTG